MPARQPCGQPAERRGDPGVTGGQADPRSDPLPWIGDFGARATVNCGWPTGTPSAFARPESSCGATPGRSRCGSGGVLSGIDDPTHQQFTRSGLRAIVEVVGLAERAL